jgi:hypothetical protein
MKHTDAFSNKHKPRHELPIIPPRNPDQPEVITGRVWEIDNGNQAVKLCDDPQGRWLKANDGGELFKKLLQAKQQNQIVNVTVDGKRITNVFLLRL